MAAPSPFRRWKRFFPEFEAIDAAIVASDPGGIADAEDLRRFKADVVEFLCDAPDEELAEDYCKILDDLMVEYLITLNKAVPVKPCAAAASTGVARAVAALQEHECQQISGLAMVTLARWRASGESDIADAAAIVEELDKLPDLVPVSRSPVVGQAPSSLHAAADNGKKRQGTDAPPFGTKTVCADTAAIAKTKTSCLPNAAAPDVGKKMPVSDAPPCTRANPLRADTAATAKAKTPAVLGKDHAEIEKMKETKRKLREGYQYEEDAKRRIQVIEAPKMPEQEQRPRKMHIILRERSRARCGAPPAAVKRSLMPCHAGPAAADIGKKIPVSDAPPCRRARTVRADTAAMDKTKAPCHAAPAADIRKKMPVSEAPPCSRARTVRADTAAIAKTKTPCLAAAPAADIGKKMPVSDAPPCSRTRTVRADTAAIDKTKTPCLAASPAADIGKKMPVSDAPPCSRANPLRAETAATTKTKMLAVLGNGEAEIEKMNETKRKLHEGYQQEADAKRQRRIQVIEAPNMPEQRPRKGHPILRERSRARCGAPPAAVKRSLMSAFHKI